MIRSILCLAAALSLAACGGSPGTVASAGSTPAQSSASAPASTSVSPLANTTLDDKAIIVAFEALDAAATAADALVAAKAITPGSPRAVTIANGLDGARKWLNIASAAQRAGQADNYVTAIAQAAAAVAGVRAALKGN